MLLATSARISQAFVCCSYHSVNFKIRTTYTLLNNHLLHPSLVLTLRYSVQTIFLLNEIRQGKGIFVREILKNGQEYPSFRSGRHPDLLLTFNTIFTACKPQTFSSCLQKLLFVHIHSQSKRSAMPIHVGKMSAHTPQRVSFLDHPASPL